MCCRWIRPVRIPKRVRIAEPLSRGLKVLNPMRQIFAAGVCGLKERGVIFLRDLTTGAGIQDPIGEPERGGIRVRGEEPIRTLAPLLKQREIPRQEPALISPECALALWPVGPGHL